MAKKVQDKNGSGTGMPVGTVLSFAGSSAPSGWLLCNGVEYSQAQYKELFSVIGSAWATCKNQSTNADYAAPSVGNFRIPDLRGTFLRGVISSGTLHPTTVSLGISQKNKTAQNGVSSSVSVSNAASTLTGTVAAVGGHTHLTTYNYVSSNKAGSGFGGSGTYAASDNNVNSGGGHSHTFSGTAAAQTATVTNTFSSSDNETVPNYTGINYIIKI